MSSQAPVYDAVTAGSAGQSNSGLSRTTDLSHGSGSTGIRKNDGSDNYGNSGYGSTRDVGSRTDKFSAFDSDRKESMITDPMQPSATNDRYGEHNTTGVMRDIKASKDGARMPGTEDMPATLMKQDRDAHIDTPTNQGQTETAIQAGSMTEPSTNAPVTDANNLPSKETMAKLEAQVNAERGGAPEKQPLSAKIANF